jgi:hypothetical protein
LDEIRKANRENNNLDKALYEKEVLKIQLKHGILHTRGIMSHKINQLSNELHFAKKQRTI